MKFGEYIFNKEGIFSIPRHIKSSLSHRIFGIPPLKCKNLKEMAEEIIKENAKEWGLIAGKGHFRYMWTVDFAKSFNGIKKILPEAYLEKQIVRIISESIRKEYIPTCFSKKNVFDMPFVRNDNCPWLFYALEMHTNEFGNKLVNRNKDGLEKIYNDYMCKNFDYKTNLISNTSKFDWMDSIARPSSTYSNLCLLQLFNSVENLGLNVKTFKKETEKAIMGRWLGNYFEDYSKSGDYLSADANVPILYFNLFDKSIRRKVKDKIEASGLLRPVPMKLREGNYKENLLFLTKLAGGYHDVIWPHMGLMYLNGLKKNGFEYRTHLKKIEEVYKKHRNILECLDLRGNPFKSLFIVTEYHFTMASGQYLELLK